MELVLAILLTTLPLHLIAWWGRHSERKRLERLFRYSLHVFNTRSR